MEDGFLPRIGRVQEARKGRHGTEMGALVNKREPRDIDSRYQEGHIAGLIGGREGGKRLKDRPQGTAVELAIAGRAQYREGGMGELSEPSDIGAEP